MAVKKSVSNNFRYMFVNSINVFLIAAYPVWTRMVDNRRTPDHYTSAKNAEIAKIILFVLFNSLPPS